jgi:tetratricopeptide (TPR) repeat protein
MNELSNLWAWATEATNQRGIHTIYLIAGLVALAIGAIWGLLKYFSRGGSSGANLTKVKAGNQSIAAGQNVTIHFGITLEQFLKALKQREDEVRQELAVLKTSEIEKRRILERSLDSVSEQTEDLQTVPQFLITSKDYKNYLKQVERYKLEELARTTDQQIEKRNILKIELVAVQKKLSNLEESFKDYNDKLIEVFAVLDMFKGEFHPDQIKKAQQSLLLGNTEIAEDLLTKALAANIGKAERYKKQGKYSEAEELLLRSLAIREKTFGLDHPDTVKSLDNLSKLYQEQGKYAEAESLYRQELAIYEKILGPEHPAVATILDDLARTIRAKQAEKNPPK